MSGTVEHDSLSRIRQWDAPVLRQLCTPVHPSSVVTLIAEMREILAATENGVGLAAPQIGEAVRVMLVQDQVFINPVLVPITEGVETVTQFHTEGCLSYPGIFIPVARFFHVRIAHDVIEDGDVKIASTELTSFPAQIAQHELDHLNGICLVGAFWRSELRQVPVDSGAQ